MSDAQALQGLNCPQCGGMVPVPEGQVIVRCPYCDLRSFVRGDRGVRRFQVAAAIGRDQAIDAMRRFLSGNWAIARDAARSSQLDEAFLTYVPFWAAWGRVAGWAFGKKKVGSGKNSRYEPREVKIVEEMSWNGVACDVGEFGVNQVTLTNQPLVPFNPDVLHAAGLVFEPVGSFVEAQNIAKADFEKRVRSKANIDRISQLFVRSLRQRYSLVYYPLWVMRYLYRGRSFQVVVDGFSGKVLYGKAPGNTLYRAAMLVGGMALGAFLAVDASSFMVYLSRNDSDDSLGIALVLGLVGLGIMALAYRAFRFGEVHEYRHGRSAISTLASVKDFDGNVNVEDVTKWLNRLN